MYQISPSNWIMMYMVVISLIYMIKKKIKFMENKKIKKVLKKNKIYDKNILIKK